MAVRYSQPIVIFYQQHVPGNRSLSAIEVSPVSVMSRETVLRQYVNSVKQDHDDMPLDCRPSLDMPVINALILSYVLRESLEVDFVLETVRPLIERHGIPQRFYKELYPQGDLNGRDDQQSGISVSGFFIWECNREGSAILIWRRFPIIHLPSKDVQRIAAALPPRFRSGSARNISDALWSRQNIGNGLQYNHGIGHGISFRHI